MLRPLRSLVVLGAVVSLMAATPGSAPLGKYTAAEHKHWAFQPRTHPAVPTFQLVAEQKWVKTPVDAFVLARMKREGLEPSPVADRNTLIRRLSLDLTGLPPTPSEIRQFVNDRPEAWEKAVDRLL